MQLTKTNIIDNQEIVRAQQAFLSKVYSWMVAGLLITAFTAWFVYSNNYDLMLAGSSLFYVLIFAQLGLVLALSGWANKMSSAVAGGTFILYSLITGLTFSLIFRAFTEESIYSTFFIAAGMFGALSLYGYFTKKDLSGWRSFLFMGLVGIILASIVNVFINFSGLNFVISVIGVIVFSGLTAFDTQKLKEMYAVQFEEGEVAAKASIVGALVLYLDFINLFLFLLRFFGNRD